MKKYWLMTSLALVVSACASKSTKDSGMPELATTKASYSEKTMGVPVTAVSSNVVCPQQDSPYEKEDWHKILPMANACVRDKEWGRVEAIGNHLATHAPLTPWGPYYLGLSASARKDFLRAQWMLELALKKAPKEGLFHYELGRVAWENGDAVTAMKELKEASSLNPSLTEAHFVMGQMALQRDDLGQARELFQKSLASDSKNVRILLASAQVEIKAKDFTKAEEFLSRAVQQNARDGKARLTLAQVQELHLKKTQEALQNYRALKQLSNEHKLDQVITLNLDEKIQALEKTLSRVDKSSQRSDRRPTAERQVSQ